MAALNPEHLFQQSEKLMAAPAFGAPRQVDLRRAVSSAYYAVFHHILAASADEFIGSAHRSTARYALVYRSVAHKSVKDLCEALTKSTMTPKVRKYAPDGFGADLPVFAAGFVDIYEKRHAADYDPSFRVSISEAKLALETARRSIVQFDAAEPAHKKAFLTILSFAPR